MHTRSLKFTLSVLTLVAIGLIGGIKVGLDTLPAHADNPTQSDTTSTTCPKCKGTMEEGFVRDYFESNSFDPAMWSPAGEKGHLFSIGKHAKIAAYRCTNCGYLELYAKQ